jgi:signal transduction histidine kinase
MTSTTSVQVTRWRQVALVSPRQWKVRFIAITSLLYFAQIALGIHDARRDLELKPISTIPFLVVALLGSCIVVGFCWLLDLPRRRITHNSISLIWFVLDLVISTLLLEFMRAKVFPPPYIPEPRGSYSSGRGLVILIVDIVISFIFVVFVDAISRVLNERRRLAENSAKQAARFQQQLLLADEHNRSIISRYLHDNVQAHMIRLGAQLGQIAEKLPPHDAAMVSSVRDVLEEVRGIDVQGAARALSPNLEASGLTTALEQLASQYASIATVHVHIDQVIDDTSAKSRNTPDGPSLALAAYRIVEQAFLNSIKHGRAKNITVQVALVNNEQVSIDVIDDGTCTSNEPGQPGAGLATIDSWSQVFQGTWNLHIQPSQGAHLAVILNTSSVT